MSSINFDGGFVDVMFSNEMIARMTKDGLLYRFNRKDIESLLDTHFLRNQEGWYFNELKNRFCAEIEGGDYIVANFSAVVKCLGYPVLFDN